MSLDEKSEEWLRHYINKYPWVQGIIEQYRLDLSLYDLNKETPTTHPHKANRTHLVGDVHFLKTFDEYVRERLPPNFSSVLDVGIGLWTYAFALAAFFRKYNNQVSISGIDNDPLFFYEARKFVQTRKLKGVETNLIDVKDLSGNHDIGVNLCPNLGSVKYTYYPKEFESARNFFYNIWRSVSEDGLFVMGLSFPIISERDMRTVLTHFFKDITINKNKYATGKSIYPVHYLITAKPKLPTEITQS